MAHGNISRTGIVTGRRVGAKAAMVILVSPGITRPVRGLWVSRGGSDSPPGLSARTDYSGATVPGLHRLPHLASTPPIVEAASGACQLPVDVSRGFAPASSISP